MGQNTTITIALPTKLVRLLDRLAVHARARGRTDASRSSLVRGAVVLGIELLARDELGEQPTILDAATVDAAIAGAQHRTVEGPRA